LSIFPAIKNEEFSRIFPADQTPFRDFIPEKKCQLKRSRAIDRKKRDQFDEISLLGLI